MKLDPDKIFPYIVTTNYLEHQEAGPEGLTYPLGNGLLVTLVHDLNGLGRNVLGSELAAVGLSPRQAHTQAKENLVKLVKSGVVTMRKFDSSQGKPFIIFTDHWLSASCVLLPDIHALATRHLGTDEICVCIPQRDSMLLFPKTDRTFRNEMMQVIRKNESDAGKPLSFGLFQIDAQGLHEFKDTE